MIIRTTKVIHADDGNTIYESTCTIDGNNITGPINPFPYIQRKLKKLHLHTVIQDEPTEEDAYSPPCALWKEAPARAPRKARQTAVKPL